MVILVTQVNNIILDLRRLGIEDRLYSNEWRKYGRRATAHADEPAPIDGNRHSLNLEVSGMPVY